MMKYHNHRPAAGINRIKVMPVSQGWRPLRPQVALAVRAGQFVALRELGWPPPWSSSSVAAAAAAAA